MSTVPQINVMYMFETLVCLIEISLHSFILEQSNLVQSSDIRKGPLGAPGISKIKREGSRRWENVQESTESAAMQPADSG